jgi:hypothetical protein
MIQKKLNSPDVNELHSMQEMYVLVWGSEETDSQDEFKQTSLSVSAVDFNCYSSYIPYCGKTLVNKVQKRMNIKVKQITRHCLE